MARSLRLRGTAYRRELSRTFRPSAPAYDRLAGCGSGSGSGGNSSFGTGIDDTATAVNPGGSYAALTEHPSHNTAIVNGTIYSIATETGEFNNSGEETSLSYSAPDGASSP
jgi:hypothetical protein